MRKDSDFSSFNGTKGLQILETGAFIDENGENKRHISMKLSVISAKRKEFTIIFRTFAGHLQADNTHNATQTEDMTKKYINHEEIFTFHWPFTYHGKHVS